MAHAYLVVGERELARTQAGEFVERSLGLSEGHPDITDFSYGLFSVDDARDLQSAAFRAPVAGTAKVIIVSAERLFHEAQNALLKLFEEPPLDTHLFLLVPHAGMILPTLRSRLVSLEEGDAETRVSPLASAFVNANAAEREKIVARILARAKSDDDEDKQAARREAEELAAGLMRITHKTWKGDTSHQEFLSDLSHFMPILATRAAPLKPILEHILLTFPHTR